MALKYILVEIGGIQTPIIFPDHVKHAELGFMLEKAILAAGFVSIDGPITPYGDSVSCNIGTNEHAHLAFAVLNTIEGFETPRAYRSDAVAEAIPQSDLGC